MMKAQGRENAEAQTSAQNPKAPKKNHCYALRSRVDQESTLDVDTGMLQLFSFNVYALLELDAMLYFVTPFVAMKFDILSDILDELFLFLHRWVIPLWLKESIRVFLYPCTIELH